MSSRAKEDYLKAIYELQEKFGIARTMQLAEKLGVRAATVTEMIQRMSKEPQSSISYKHHQGVRLTGRGRKQAMEIVRRHRLLETFLHRTLGMSWNEIHEEAEVLEHHLSRRVAEAIDRHLEFPKFDPHGEPIPDADGNIPPQERIPLSEIEAGGRFEIVCVDPISDQFLSRLDDMDIGIGTTGRILSKDNENGALSIELNVENQAPHTVLTRTTGDRIYVKKL